VPDNSRLGEEPMGSKAKFWCILEDGRQYLFKFPRPGTGEDWAEKIASEIAEVLNIPHAHVDLAQYHSKHGTVTLAVTSEGDTLVHGNELIYGLSIGCTPLKKPCYKKLSHVSHLIE
jgi:hypothetical protein